MPPIQAFLYHIKYYLFFAFGFVMLLLLVGFFVQPQHLVPLLAHPATGMVAIGIAGAQIGYFLVSNNLAKQRKLKMIEEMDLQVYRLRGKFDSPGGWNLSVFSGLVAAFSSLILLNFAVHPLFIGALILFFLFRTYIAYSGNRSILLGHSTDHLVYDIDGTVILPWHKIKEVEITREHLAVHVGESYDLTIPLFIPFTEGEERELLRLMQEIKIQSNSHGVPYIDFFIKEGKDPSEYFIEE